ncbi:MAG: GIY-YIG nuclease family protein [Planctomycetota bacterium]
MYVLRTGAGSLYTGITNDVERRLRAHATPRGAKSLRGRGPLTIVYQRRLGQRGLALRVEHALKRVRKSEKESIVSSSPSRARLLRMLGVERDV